MNIALQAQLDAISHSDARFPSVAALIEIANAWDKVRRADGAFRAPAIHELALSHKRASNIGNFDGPLGSGMYVSIVRWVRFWCEASEAVRAGPLHAAVDEMIRFGISVCAGTQDRPVTSGGHHE